MTSPTLAELRAQRDRIWSKIRARDRGVTELRARLRDVTHKIMALELQEARG